MSTKREKKQLLIKVMAIILCLLMVGSGVAMVIPYILTLL